MAISRENGGVRRCLEGYSRFTSAGRAGLLRGGRAVEVTLFSMMLFSNSDNQCEG